MAASLSSDVYIKWLAENNNNNKLDIKSIDVTLQRTYLKKTAKRNIVRRPGELFNILGSTKSKITKDKHGRNVPHLEITEVVLVQCEIVNNDY